MASHARSAMSGRDAVADGGSLVAGDVREIDAAALEHVAFLEQPRDAAAALGSRPFVAPERLAVDGLERGDDARLQAEKVGAGGGDVHCRVK